MSLQCLIDSDILLYEVGFGSEAAHRYDNPGSSEPPHWQLVEDKLFNKIEEIVVGSGGSDPIFFLTGTGNFRNEIAKRVPYKSRPGNKPYHYDNIKATIKGVFNATWVDGLEADDLMSIEQTSRPGETIICTRDKDLRSVSGWNYGWELEGQPSFGPFFIDGYGHIELTPKGKLTGWGTKFFLAQCIMGDPTDSIPGLKGKGTVAAFETVGATLTYEEGLEAVLGAYTAFYGHPVIARDELLEQGRLLHMTRQLNPDGSPVLWAF